MSKKSAPLDNFLHEIEKNFISIKDAPQQFAVFKHVFDQVHEKIKQVDNYYNKYSSKIQYAGSFYDGVKVGQLDEFDMDIIIRLPINYDDIIIENELPGFVKLKIGSAFDNLDKQPHWESHHKVMRDWRDDEKYFLQSQFRSWMESAVAKAINALDRKVMIDDITYNLACKKSGPAFTVNVRNLETKFEVDVDLVPVILFKLPRWPNGYRKKEVDGDSNKNTWLVVPKPNKGIEDVNVQNRCWRLAFHDQERDLIKGCKNLKPTLRLLKKLRDSLGMKAIASYYIKTLFLWEVQASVHEKYWENKMSVLFRDMVQKFHDALEKKTIPYFWNKGYNLIGALNDGLCQQYKAKLKKLLGHIEDNSITEIVKCLLTPGEFDKFKNVEIYKNYCSDLTKAPVTVPPVKKSSSAAALGSSQENPKNPNPRVESPPTEGRDDSINTSLLKKILISNQKMESELGRLLDQTSVLQDKMHNLEMQMKKCTESCGRVQPKSAPAGFEQGECPLVMMPMSSLSAATVSMNEDLRDLFTEPPTGSLI